MSIDLASVKFTDEEKVSFPFQTQSQRRCDFRIHQAALNCMETAPLNGQQASALEIMRRELADELQKAPQFPELVGDRRLLRFLRGHKFDIATACKMMKAMFAWRRDNNIDEIREKIDKGKMTPDQFPCYDKIVPFYPFMFDMEHKDKLGHPLNFERTGRMRPRALMQSVTQEEFVHFHIHMMEYVQIHLERLSAGAEKGHLMRLCAVKDLDGLGVHMMIADAITWMQSLVRVTQANYPETMDKCFLLNTPWAFYTIWKVVKPWLAERTIKKVNILDANYLEPLCAQIDTSELPPLWGGSCVYATAGFTPKDTCEESRTELNVGRASVKTVSMDLESGERNMNERDSTLIYRYSALFIHNRSPFAHPSAVLRCVSGDIARWSYQCKSDNDIIYSASFARAPDGPAAMPPAPPASPSGAERLPAGYGPVERISGGGGGGGDSKMTIEGTGDYTAKVAGRLTLRFDNSFTRVGGLLGNAFSCFSLMFNAFSCFSLMFNAFSCFSLMFNAFSCSLACSQCCHLRSFGPRQSFTHSP